ncbi:nucleoside hydrolase [Corynebacterium mayonis]|uniref:nucleoside hydrolase n=1 Tax=Corynebacterium mayonis TaxID=3062461 RepID=UPI0031409445
MRVILDCDPGIDDTIALIYLSALHHEGRIEIDAVTTTAGNIDADQGAVNAAWVLGQCALRTTPLAAGVTTPLKYELTTTPETHGPTGLGYITAPQRFVESDWDALWIDSIERGTQDLHLIITGPMTNLATFKRLHPHHYARLQHITVMGGAFNYPGNTTPSAEWNFWVDPHAAKEVFAAAPAPLTVCSLEVTEKMLLEPERLEGIVDKLGAFPMAKKLPEIMRFYFEFHEEVGEGYRAQIHDLLACEIALGTVLFDAPLTTIDIEADSELMRGTSVIDTRGIWERENNAHVVTTADIDAAWAEFERACGVHARFTNGGLAAIRHARAED